MADFALQVTMGGESLTLAHMSVQDMMKVRSWTGLKNRREWHAAIADEEPEALLAAYVLAKQRKGETVRFSEVDFDLDSLDATWVDEAGREVEPKIERNPDGTVKTGSDGVPIPVLGKDGQPVWVHTETGEPVPPTAAA